MKLNPAQKYAQSESLLLEQRINRIYRRAYRETIEKQDAFWKKYETQVAEKYEEYKSGAITQQEYYSWVNGHKKIGKQIDQLADNIATRMTDTGAIAQGYINSTSPRIFAESANYEAYTIDRELGFTVGGNFALIDDDALKAVMENNVSTFDAKWKHNPDRLPWAKANIDSKKIYNWTYSKVQDSLYTGILKGESIHKIASRIMNVTESNRATAIRNARTSITSAYNQGQIATFERAAELGIEVEKEWIATSDARTRDSHAHLDGIRVAWNKKFPNGLLCPGDPKGPPEEVYNCRCSMARVPLDEESYKSTYFDKETETYQNRYNTVKSYSEWKKQKSK